MGAVCVCACTSLCVPVCFELVLQLLARASSTFLVLQIQTASMSFRDLFSQLSKT